MIRRSLLVLICVAAVSLLVASASFAADIDVTSITPKVGDRGESVACTIGGVFFVPINATTRLPTFTLTRGATTINGSTSRLSASGDRASVTFAIPSDVPTGVYDLNARQVRDMTTYTETLAGAFTVRQPPVVTSLNPARVVAGSGTLTLTVYGDYFFRVVGPPARQSVVVFDGSVVPTDYNAATVVTAHVPAAALATPRTVQVRVYNQPLVGDGLYSEPYSFTIDPRVPSVLGLDPTSVWAGYVKDDIVLTVTGTDFASGARIVFNGVEKTATTYVSATRLTVPLTAADIATPGSVMVSVENPPFPPGTSSAGAVPLTVQAETTDPVVTIAGADEDWHSAPVTLAFSASDGQSGVQKVQYMAPPGVSAWTDGASYTVPTSTQGAIAVSVRALDWCNRVGTASETVNIDTTRPRTATLGNATVKKGMTARLKYRVTEPAGLSPRADVVLKIKRGDGSTARTFRIYDAPTNANRTYSFTCTLAKGTYAWYVHATDLAGNPQQNVARATLRVK